MRFNMWLARQNGNCNLFVEREILVQLIFNFSMLNAFSPSLPRFFVFVFIRFHGFGAYRRRYSRAIETGKRKVGSRLGLISIPLAAGYGEDGRLAKFYPVDNSTDNRSYSTNREGVN